MRGQSEPLERPGPDSEGPELASVKPEPASERPGPASGGRGGDGRTDGRTDGQTYGQTGRTDSPCILQDFVPFGAAALLSLKAELRYDTAGQGYR